jgi:cysteine-rich repeat protein
MTNSLARFLRGIIHPQRLNAVSLTNSGARHTERGSARTLAWSRLCCTTLVLALAAAPACSDPPLLLNGDNSQDGNGGNSGKGGGTGIGNPPIIGGGGESNGDDDGGTGSVPDPVCGNGLLEDTELCDDGNRDPDDGCSEDCGTVDPNYYCPDPGKECDRAHLAADRSGRRSCRRRCGQAVVSGP